MKFSTKEKSSKKEKVLITRLTLRVIAGYLTQKLHHHYDF